MPAIDEEIEDAEAEGVRLLLYRQPVALMGNGKVSSAACSRRSRRVRPMPAAVAVRWSRERTSSVACDKVLLALGQTRELRSAAGRLADARRAAPGKATRPCRSGSRATVRPATARSRTPSATDGAIALAVLSKPGWMRPDEPPSETTAPVAPAQIRFSHFDVMPPHRDRQIPPSVRRVSFEESNLGLSGPEEAGRCFSCGHCTHCDTCLLYCPDGVIRAQRGWLPDRRELLQGLRHVRRRVPAQRDGDA